MRSLRTRCRATCLSRSSVRRKRMRCLAAASLLASGSYTCCNGPRSVRPRCSMGTGCRRSPVPQSGRDLAMRSAHTHYTGCCRVRWFGHTTCTRCLPARALESSVAPGARTSRMHCRRSGRRTGSTRTGYRRSSARHGRDLSMRSPRTHYTESCRALWFGHTCCTRCLPARALEPVSSVATGGHTCRNRSPRWPRRSTRMVQSCGLSAVTREHAIRLSSRHVRSPLERKLLETVDPSRDVRS